MDLDTPLTYIKGVGPARAAMLEAKGLSTVEDLLGYVPFRYEDRSNVKTVTELAPGEMATVIAEVRSASLSGFKRRNLGLFEASFTDRSRGVLVGKWFHGGYLANVLSPGQKVALYGKVEFDSYAGQLTMMHPELEVLSDDDDAAEATLHLGRVVPVYEAVSKISTRVLRALIHRVLQTLPPVEDQLPEEMRRRLKLPDRGTAERLPVPGAIPADFRGVLLAGMRRGVEAEQGAHHAWHFFPTDGPGAREGEGDAAVQAHWRAEARARGNCAGHDRAAPHEPAAARRCG